MPAEITDIDRSMISNMMLTKSYSEIAKALNVTKDDIGAVVLELTLGTGLVPYELKLKERWKKKNDNRPKQSLGQPKAKTPLAIEAAKRKASDKAFNESLKKQKLQAAKVQQQNLKAAATVKRRPPMYKSKAVDYTQLSALRIDRKTTIYLKPGEDPEKVKARFIKNYKHLLLKNEEEK